MSALFFLEASEQGIKVTSCRLSVAWLGVLPELTGIFRFVITVQSWYLAAGNTTPLPTYTNLKPPTAVN